MGANYIKPLFHLSKHTSKHQCYPVHWCYRSKRPLCKARRPLCFRFKANFSPKSVSFTFWKRSSNFASILHAMLSLFSTWRLCSREQPKKKERFLLVRGEFFRQPILTNHIAGFLFSLSRQLENRLYAYLLFVDCRISNRK